MTIALVRVPDSRRAATWKPKPTVVSTRRPTSVTTGLGAGGRPMTRFRALRDMPDPATGQLEDLGVVETVDALGEKHAAALLTRAGYAVLDVVHTDVLVAPRGEDGDAQER
jgi:hypothetical protein